MVDSLLTGAGGRPRSDDDYKIFGAVPSEWLERVPGAITALPTGLVGPFTSDDPEMQEIAERIKAPRMALSAIFT